MAFRRRFSRIRRRFRSMRFRRPRFKLSRRRRSARRKGTPKFFGLSLTTLAMIGTALYLFIPGVKNFINRLFGKKS